MSEQHQPQGRQLAPIQQFRQDLERMTPEFQSALPAHIPVERFRRVAQTAVTRSPELLKSDPKALLGACMMAAQDGLLPDGREGAIVLFKGKAQWMPMVYGIIKKMRNSGEILSLTAHPVYREDEFRYILGDEESIHHEPSMKEDRGPVIAAYAIAKLTGGGIERRVMLKADIEKRRKAGSANSPMWTGWYEEGACKTVIKALAKRLPMSTEVERVLERDDAMHAISLDHPPAQQITPSSDPFLAASAGAQIEHQPVETDYDADTGEVDPGDGWPGPDTAAQS